MNTPLARYGGYLFLIAIAVVSPYIVTSALGRLLAITALIYAMLAASWNLTLGFGGIFNFAHVGFFGLGGYVSAIATVSWQWNPWASLGLGAVVGALAGALAYLPVVRMRGIYIALITFIFVQLCYYLTLALPGLTGGSSGLPGLPSLSLGSFSLGQYAGLGYVWLLGLAVAVLLVSLDLILTSNFGRSLIALRDNEQLAVSRGINRVRQQLIAFAVSGGIAGVAGALYVSYFRVADTSLFGFGFVTLGLSMIFLGGTGHVWGPVLGAILVTLVDHELSNFGAWRDVIIGGGTVLVLVFLPQGLSGLLSRAAAEGSAKLIPRARRTGSSADLTTRHSTEGSAQ